MVDKKTREQNRGLYAIGLLAVLLSFRLQDQPLIFMNVDMSIFIDLNIFFWIIYGFAMIVSFSDDFLPENIRDFFYGLGSIFLLFSNILFIFLSIIFSLLLHPERSEMSIRLIYAQLYTLLAINIIRIVKKYWNYDFSEINIHNQITLNYNNIKKSLLIVSILFSTILIYLDLNDIMVDILYVTGLMLIVAYGIARVLEILQNEK